MKQEDTRQKILAKALELFSVHGYDAVSVGQIAAAVGIKAPSLYNHFPSKCAIFDAIVEATAAQYEEDTDRIDIHVQTRGRISPSLPASRRMGCWKRSGRSFSTRSTTRPSAASAG